MTQVYEKFSASLGGNFLWVSCMSGYIKTV